MSKPKSDIERHFEDVQDLGCLVCGQFAVIHHCMGGSIKDLGFHKGMGQKNNDWLVIPLCPRHHNGDEGLHTIGVLSWEERFGTQADFLGEVSNLLGLDVFGTAKSHAKK